MSESLCPCGGERSGHSSDRSYETCCQPLHLGLKSAETAEQLMRSRYSAFAKLEIDYLVQTTAIGQQQDLDVDAIRQWAEANQWQKLEVLQHQPKVDNTHALVEFKAYYHDGQQAQVHHEQSYFVRYEQHWYFLDPTTEHTSSMKQPCLCGSGKKFKQCCAHFL